jgi:hypothetical protein
MVAAYVLQSNEPGPIAAGDGALAGLLAGLTGAVIHFVLSIPIDILVGPWEREFGQRLLDMTGNAQMREAISNGLEQSARGGLAFIIVRRLGVLVFMFVLCGTFSTVGGVLGALVFKKQAPAPAQP